MAMWCIILYFYRYMKALSTIISLFLKPIVTFLGLQKCYNNFPFVLIYSDERQYSLTFVFAF